MSGIYAVRNCLHCGTIWNRDVNASKILAVEKLNDAKMLAAAKILAAKILAVEKLNNAKLNNAKILADAKNAKFIDAEIFGDG